MTKIEFQKLFLDDVLDLSKHILLVPLTGDDDIRQYEQEVKLYTKGYNVTWFDTVSNATMIGNLVGFVHENNIDIFRVAAAQAPFHGGAQKLILGRRLWKGHWNKACVALGLDQNFDTAPLRWKILQGYKL